MKELTMQLMFKNCAMSGMVGAAAMVALTSAAQAAAFEGRDASNAVDTTCTNSGTNKCVSFYNATLDITILNDWNIGQGTWNVAAAPGSAQAIAAAVGSAATGLTGWVLPTGDENSQSGPANQYSSILRQVGGKFIDLQAQFDGVGRGGGYWSSTEYAPDPSRAWVFATVPGPMGGFSYFNSLVKSGTSLAVAVRPGDVAAVPEPGTGAMMLLGLGAFAVSLRRRRR